MKIFSLTNQREVLISFISLQAYLHILSAGQKVGHLIEMKNDPWGILEQCEL